MDIHPQDLGTERYLALLRQRLAPVAGPHGGMSTTHMDEPESKEASKSSLRRIRGRSVRRYWVKDLGLDEATGERLGFAIWRGHTGVGIRIAVMILTIYLLIPTIITAFASGTFIIPFLLFTMWALLTSVIVHSPRVVIKKLHKKRLVSSEVEQMLPSSRGRLERAYFGLVLDALRVEIPSESAQNDIKAALRDLGDTVSRLPADAVPVMDAARLHAQAEEQRSQALVENDSFVKASLLRQAEGYERRASLSDENVVSARRLSALRREARVQMDALRAVLMAFQQTSQHDSTSVAHLSDAVSRVAQEAQAVSVARRELEDDEIARLFGKPLPANLPPQPILPSRKIIDPIPQETQPQVVQTRNWWRNQ